MSMAFAGKTLEKAAEAGVKSAQVSEDAGIIDKTAQMFKTIPEALKVSGQNAYRNLRTLSLTGTSVAEKSIVDSQKKFINRRMDKISNSLSKEQQVTLKRYLGAETRQQILDSVTEENAELARKLYSIKGIWGNCDYARNAENMCEYYFRTIPKILNSDNPQLKELALQLFDEPISEYYRYNALSSLAEGGNNIELLQNELMNLHQVKIANIAKPHIISPKNKPTYSYGNYEGIHYYKFYDENNRDLKYLVLSEPIEKKDLYTVYQQVKAGKYSGDNVLEQWDYQFGLGQNQNIIKLKIL